MTFTHLYQTNIKMHFIIVLIFSILVLSMILLSIDGIYLNNYTYSDARNLYNDNNTIDIVRVGDARTDLLKAKRGQADDLIILAYIIIAAAIIVPNLPQID